MSSATNTMFGIRRELKIVQEIGEKSFDLLCPNVPKWYQMLCLGTQKISGL